MRPSIPSALEALACLSLLLASAACRPARAAADDHPEPVGRQQVMYADSTRRDWTGTADRPLQTTVWYPAASGAKESPWTVAIFAAGRNALDAPMAAAPARLPLVVVSHGTGGSAVTLAWLAETLASHGYIVAAVNHHGNTAAEDEPRLEGTLVWWDRPRDLTVLIDKLTSDPRLGPRIDTGRIGVAGFSLGGYAALASVGARLSLARFMASCAAPASAALCKLPPESNGRFSDADVQRLLVDDVRVKEAMSHMEDDYSDRRIRSAFVMAPVFGQAMTTESLAAIAVPVRIVVGSDDLQAVPAVSVAPIAAAVPGVSLDVLPSVGHYTFVSVCTSKGRAYVKQLCSDADGVDRDAVHRRVAGWAVEFFGATLTVK